MKNINLNEFNTRALEMLLLQHGPITYVVDKLKHKTDDVYQAGVLVDDGCYLKYRVGYNHTWNIDATWDDAIKGALVNALTLLGMAQ